MGKKKAQEDLMFLKSQRTYRIAKMAGQDKKYESSKRINIRGKPRQQTFCPNNLRKVRNFVRQ